MTIPNDRRERGGFPGTPAAAVALGIVVIALMAGAVPIAAAIHHKSGPSSQTAIVLAFAIVGFVLAFRQPRNAMGWIVFGVAFFFVLDDDASGYAILDYRQHGGSLPLGQLAVILQPSWAPAIVLFGLAILMFPDAKLPQGRWRLVVWAFLAIALLWMVGAFGASTSAIIEHRVQIDGSGNLVLLDHPTGNWAWWNVVQDAFFPLLGMGWLASIGRQIGTFRRSYGDRRLQLKWLLTGGVMCIVGGVLSVVFSSPSSTSLRLLGESGTIGLLGLPVCIGVAVLKYRLYDIDRLISRTLSYAVVTGLLIGLYVTIVVLTTDVLSFSSPVAVTASTLVAAALFSPLRRRVQHWVDRRFNRSGYDAEATVAAFSARLRESVDLDSVRGDLLDVVGRSFEPAHASVWIKTPQ
jgi:hypothetical protein